MTLILAFSVPLLPPSVNHYKLPRKGSRGWYKTPESIAFIKAVSLLAIPRVPENWPAPWRLAKGVKLFYEATITVYIRESNFLRVDADNFSKVGVDSLTAAALITDDRYIIDHRIRKLPVLNALDERTDYLIRVVERPCI